MAPGEEGRYQRLMAAHHYLGALPKIGETMWYAAHLRGEWLALAGFTSAALKCAARDRWIGWDFRVQHDRQHLLANNSRFLVLPGPRTPNLASRVLALCARRAAADWPARFGHPLLLLETFVDPARFRGTAYRAANWTCVGRTRGFRRVRGGYVPAHGAAKLVFVRPLVADARVRLARPALLPADRHGDPKGMLSADTMRSLPEYFLDVDDPRRPQGRRHPLHVVLAIAAAPTSRSPPRPTSPPSSATSSSSSATAANQNSARSATRGEAVGHPGKIRVTIPLDGDIVAAFRTRGENNGRGYQTAINQALREHLANEDLEATLRRVVREELLTLESRDGPDPSATA